MEVQLTVFYQDGSSGIIEFEKPGGAHPESIMVAAEGLLVAEATGKRVARIGWSKVNPFSNPKNGPLVIDDNLVARQDVLEQLSKGLIPMPDRYKSLYC